MPETPARYADFLKRKGGTNLFGEPNFILHWGEWPIKRVGCADQLLAPFLDCWTLAQWRPAEDFGPPSLWPRELGEYPSRGAYLIVQPFRYSGITAMLDSPMLNLTVLNMMVDLLIKHQDDSLADRKLAFMEMKDREDKEIERKIADCLEDSMPVLGEAGSFVGQKNCNTALKQKMEAIEANWKTISIFQRQMPKRTSISR